MRLYGLKSELINRLWDDMQQDDSGGDDNDTGSKNGINCSNDNNGESSSHAPPHGPPPIVNISTNTKGADINGENGEFGHTGTMKDYGECNNTTPVLSYTHLNNNNDNNECEYVQRTQYRGLGCLFRFRRSEFEPWKVKKFCSDSKF